MPMPIDIGDEERDSDAFCRRPAKTLYCCGPTSVVACVVWLTAARARDKPATRNSIPLTFTGDGKPSKLPWPAFDYCLEAAFLGPSTVRSTNHSRCGGVG